MVCKLFAIDDKTQTISQSMYLRLTWFYNQSCKHVWAIYVAGRGKEGKPGFPHA